jgi:transketolase
MRQAFADVLVRLAAEDDRVVFLTGDLGFQVFDAFRERFGPRYINVGVAEAQMVSAACGLALVGFRPVAYSIASFATARPFEQVKLDLGYAGVPVVLVGAGGGFTYANAGVTHHAPDDLGLMCLIPGMTVVAPGCPSELAALLPQLLRLKGPSYLRIGKYGEPDYQALDVPVLGRARRLRAGCRVGLLCTGDVAVEAVAAADLLSREGISLDVWQFHTVKPIDTDALEDVAARCGVLLVAEEHIPTGGLGDAVARWLATRGGGPRLVVRGAPDAFVLGSPSREELREQLGYSQQQLAATCRQLWQNLPADRP